MLGGVPGALVSVVLNDMVQATVPVPGQLKTSLRENQVVVNTGDDEGNDRTAVTKHFAGE